MRRSLLYLDEENVLRDSETGRRVLSADLSGVAEDKAFIFELEDPTQSDGKRVVTIRPAAESWQGTADMLRRYFAGR